MMLGAEISGRYRLDRRLGAGGMSTVYVARDQVLERDVAVKLLAEHLAEDEAFVARFRREALAAAKLVHPNIVQVYDSGRDPETGRHHIVMEYVAGRTVADLLRAHEHLSVDQAVDIAVQACNGLDYAHRHGVIHRDVKPGNLLLNGDGVMKLADFGIAKAAEDSRITQLGSVLGTAAYLSPERARGEEALPGSDLYSLGVVLYQMLSGQLPYVSGSLTELALRQQEGNPPPLGDLNPEVGPALERVVHLSLASDQRDRYASAPEMRDALEAARKGRDTAATLALETAATRRIATRQAPPAPPRREPARRPATTTGRGAYRVPPTTTGRRRGSFTRFMALVFLFVLIAAIVAGVIVLSSDSTQTQEFGRVVRDTTRDQIDGLRDLIENARR
jgi:serine/threonine protein kinase